MKLVRKTNAQAIVGMVEATLGKQFCADFDAWMRDYREKYGAAEMPMRPHLVIARHALREDARIFNNNTKVASIVWRNKEVER